MHLLRRIMQLVFILKYTLASVVVYAATIHRLKYTIYDTSITTLILKTVTRTSVWRRPWLIPYLGLCRT